MADRAGDPRAGRRLRALRRSPRSPKGRRRCSPKTPTSSSTWTVRAPSRAQVLDGREALMPVFDDLSRDQATHSLQRPEHDLAQRGARERRELLHRPPPVHRGQRAKADARAPSIGRHLRPARRCLAIRPSATSTSTGSRPSRRILRGSNRIASRSTSSSMLHVEIDCAPILLTSPQYTAWPSRYRRHDSSISRSAASRSCQPQTLECPLVAVRHTGSIIVTVLRRSCQRGRIFSWRAHSYPGPVRQA